MKRRVIIQLIFAYLLTCANSAFSQKIDSLRLDSLVAQLTLQKNDESTVDVYNALTNDYLEISDYETANEYAELGRTLAKKLSYDSGLLEASCNLGYLNLAYYLDFQKSVDYLDEAHDIAKPINSTDYLIRIYRGYTSTYAASGEYEKALDFNNQAIALAREKNDQLLISDLSAYGGNIYEEIGEKEKAIEMYEEVVTIETASNFENTSKAALVTVAHYYYLTGDANKSLKQYRIALKKFKRLKDDRWVAYTHSQMAKIYIELEEVEMAEKHGLKGLEIAEELNLKKEKADNYEVLAKVYSALEDPEKAAFYQEKYDKLMEGIEVEVVSEVEIPSDEPEVESAKSTVWSSIFNTAIILLLVIIAVVISGFVGSKK